MIITNLEKIFACQSMNCWKEVNHKQVKEHQNISYLNQSKIQKLHLIVKQMMTIT